MSRSRLIDIDVDRLTLEPIDGLQNVPLLPLKKAVEPVLTQIPNLMNYVDIALVHCHLSPEDNLSRDQSASIYLYTMEWDEESLYKILNTALRSKNRKDVRPWFRFLKLFLSALEKLPSAKTILWRGINKNLTLKFKNGEKLTWWTITSCSTDLAVIESFLQSNVYGTVFMIDVQNGKSISKYSHFAKEEEVILPPGTQLRVISNTKKSERGLHIVQLKELMDNEQVNHPVPNTLIGTKQNLNFFNLSYRSIICQTIIGSMVGAVFYIVASRLKAIQYYARTAMNSPYPRVPLSSLARFTMVLGPLLKYPVFIAMFGYISVLSIYKRFV